MNLLIPLLLTHIAAGGDHVLYVSWGDQILHRRAADRLDTPAKIAASVPEWTAMAGAETVYWRISSWRIRQDHDVRRTSVTRYWEAVDAAHAAGDPELAAAQAAHAAGRQIYAYETLFDEGAPTDIRYGDNTPFPWQSRFTIEHPEYLVVDRTGTQRQWGVLEYAWPEVRQFMMQRFLTFLDRYPFDGVYLCTRTHSKPADTADQFGYGEPIVAEFRRRYGVDIRTQPFDHAAWERLRGEYLTQFLREFSVALHARGKQLSIGIPLGDCLGPPYGHLALDWPTWVKEGLIDELVVGVRTGNEHYPSMRGHDRERGYRLSADENWGLPDWRQEVVDRYGPACRAAGVKLRKAWGTPGPAMQADLAALPLDGFMIDATSLVARGGYLALPSTPAHDLADGRFTLSLWLKPADVADYPRLVSKYDHALPENAGRGWEIYLGEGGTVVVRVNDGASDRHLTTKLTVPSGRWSHLVCVGEGAGGRWKVYLDGRLDEVTLPAPTAIRAVPCELLLGRYAGEGRPFRGALRDFGLYTTPRAADDLPDTAPDLLASYRLDGLDGGPAQGVPAATPRLLRSAALQVEPGALWFGPLP